MDEFERLENQLKSAYDESKRSKPAGEPTEIPVIRQPEIHMIDREGKQKFEFFKFNIAF